MLLSDRDARRLRPRRWMLPVGLILLFIILFWREVTSVIWLFWTIGITVLGFEPGELRPDLGYAFQVICFNIVLGFLWVFVSWLVLASSQAMLPVRVPLEYKEGNFRLVDRFQEIYRTAFHLLLSIFRIHGRTIFVRDGKQIDSPSEFNRRGFGVTVVDFNSAAVFEEQIPPPGALRSFNSSIMNILVTLGLVDKFESPRVRGPGIVFTRPLERIRAVVDLRKQFRIRTQVPGYTREGIELKANVWVLFTIGQMPDILQVSYDGEFRRENLRTLIWETLPEGRMRMAGFSDDLDDADRREMHQYARVAGRLGEISGYAPLQSGERWPVFNPQQVFSAVFAQARGAENELVSWGELPTAVASELFREVLSSVNYEDIYKGDDPSRFPLPGVKARLRHAMRNNGILSYRVVFHRERRPLQAGMEYDLADLRVSLVQPLRNSKVLRDRGIKIISSGFGDLTPLSPEIWEQRVDSWSAPWVREIATLRAEHDLEVERIRSHARAQAQQQLFYSLKRLFEDGSLSEEALAIRLYQSLEQAAANPLTRQLLPANTLDMMRTIHHWLLPPGDIGRFIQGPKG